MRIACVEVRCAVALPGQREQEKGQKKRAQMVDVLVAIYVLGLLGGASVSFFYFRDIVMSLGFLAMIVFPLTCAALLSLAGIVGR
jgi:hypothetical protein